MGAEVRIPTTKEVELYELNGNQGVVITSLDSRGSLAHAGFEVGDMILAIDGQPIEGMENFADLVTSLKPNQKISVLALDHRTGNTRHLRVIVR